MIIIMSELRMLQEFYFFIQCEYEPNLVEHEPQNMLLWQCEQKQIDLQMYNVYMYNINLFEYTMLHVLLLRTGQIK